MKKYILLFFIIITTGLPAQEIMANVTINSEQLAGSNVQVYRNLERTLRDFINKTSWSGKRLQNFEKIKANFAMVLNGRDGNRFQGTLVVQAVRPVYGTTYESPLININDQNITFEYVEGENLIFNERQFSGKNLTDLISFYIYMILGYDADTFQNQGGQENFTRAQNIARNAVNRGFPGWSVTEGPRTRASLVDYMMNTASQTLRNTAYKYHRSGLDNLSNPASQNQARQIIAESLMQLMVYENSFQQNYAINLFLDTKASEVYEIFAAGPDGGVNMQELKNTMVTLSPKNTDSKWSRWK